MQGRTLTKRSRAQGVETRKRLARFRAMAWSPEQAPRAPEIPPHAATLQRLGTALARGAGQAPARGLLGPQLAAAALRLKGGGACS